MSSAILKVADVSHQYSDTWALRNINLEINDFGVIGLLGSNGAGKSTLMNIICGCLNQTSGSVSVEGLDGRENPLDMRRKIGFLPQQAPLAFEMTIEEYLLFCARVRGMTKEPAVKAVENVMEMCGLSSMRKRQISNLSGGYRQRTGIAQAVVHRPPLVVLDEPTVGLDPNQILAMRELILELGEKHTVVFSTHILPEVEALCRDVVMVERGQVVFHDDIEAFRTAVEPHAIIIVAQRPPSLSTLESINSNVAKVERLGAKKFRIRYVGGREITTALLNNADKYDWSIEEIYFEKTSLEDVFASLAKSEAS